MLTGADGAALEVCLAAGGVAVVPTDTVYGLACAADNPAAVARLYAVKGRAPNKPAAVVFFSRERACAALPELEPAVARALARLLPGPVTVLLANPARRFALACGPDPGTLGVRVVDVPGLGAVRTPALQSSANHAGGHDARRLGDVPAAIRAGADLELDGATLPGTPSTVVDLRRYADDGTWAIVRPGAAPSEEIERILRKLPG